MPTLILTEHIRISGIERLEVYRAHGGYSALRKAVSQMTPEQVRDEIEASRLRGRGGAFFPTGRKWKSLPDNGMARYIVANADESEPGTYKDHYLMVRLPHLLIEGMAIAGYAVGAHRGFIYLRGEARRVQRVLVAAIEEARREGIIGPDCFGAGRGFDIDIHMGAGAYMAGEETGMLESLEGKRAFARIRPQYHAAAHGLYGSPTVVDNVETFSNVAWILNHGAEAYRQHGVPNAPGTRLICTSGRVAKPGVYELPMGVTLREVIWEHSGGMSEGSEFKAAIPGGASTHILPAEFLDLSMDPDSYAAKGFLIGAGSVTVMDQRDCVIAMALRLNTFFRNESCGQCTPCRDGADWLVRLLRKFETGGAKESDIDLLWDLCDNIIHKTICALGWAATVPPQSTIRFFREEYLAHIAAGGCPYGNHPPEDTFGFNRDLEFAAGRPAYREDADWYTSGLDALPVRHEYSADADD